MPATLFTLPANPTIPVKGEAAEYPIGRIFCVGRNYAAHAAEMGAKVDREAPFYFTKSPTTAAMTGAEVPYPAGTADYHYEMELAFVIGAPAFRVAKEDALQVVYGYCCALDMTRRDIQADAKAKRRPWDASKDFENSTIFASITKADDFAVGSQRIHLEVDGVQRQDSTLDLMIHDVAAIIADLSKYYHLRPGDVILTGTPEGVGPVVAGETITGGIDGLEPVELTIGAAE
ncbi:fumarylacetoacetate hydrolase family protein [Marivivens donghaensis]|uniref:Fumarylacetoacetate hydrolase family protein n=1 Tax=Marivivens donghaensis TaxID=1699413 RepID=A0ABX0W0E8_9RHOB|nr:fumarylacetoacetate hydrolase family protein [Marivivens donghaensis]NIY73691.1 fumarylacetoacetate hydrolase family protein [Marivivens donghaensis]